MKTILALTDFSKGADNAITYASGLAKALNQELIILHAYVPPPIIGMDGPDYYVEEKSGVKASLMLQLDDSLSNISADVRKNLTLRTMVKMGEVTEAINEVMDETDISFIVQGTRHNRSLEDFLFGRTATHVIRNANAPVISVPEEFEFNLPDNIVYASDLEELDIQLVKSMIPLAESMDSVIHVVHSFSEDTMTQQEDAEEFKAMLEKEVAYPKLKRQSTTYKDTFESIVDFVEKDNANLLVMREKEQGVFYHWFHKDLVTKFNHHTSIPLMTYNDHTLEKQTEKS